MLKREIYLNKIRPFIDKPFIKVITGIRRCGKSAIMIILRDELKKMGISDENIIYINFESMEYSDIEDAKALYSYIKGKIKNDEKYYIFFDEIQEVKNWEKAINSMFVDLNADIYITGSNSRLLSSELATYIAGRYVQFDISTLSFKEFRKFRSHYLGENENVYDSFKRFLRYGGFPAMHIAEYNIESVYKAVRDIYSSAILRDTVQKNNIRNIELLERVVKYVFDNLGNIFSAKNVADYFKSQQRKADINTVYNYINALEEACIIRKIQRYDIKGKEILKTNEKYYIGDQSLKYALMGFKDRDISGILENIVCNDLIQKGYDVFVGKLDDKEIDFTAEKNGNKVYIQVSYKLESQSTVDREFNTLLEIKDNYPKYVVTMDDLFADNIDGIKRRHIADFLMLDEF